MKRLAVGLIAVCGLLTGCSSWVPTVVNNGVNYGINLGRTISADRSFFNVLDDLNIKSTIDHILLDETLLLDINANVYQGRVMLTGSVKDAETLQKVEELTRQVDGVRELYNEIQVTHESWLKSLPKDILIESMLSARMVLEPDVSSTDYQVRAANGVVYVLGLARSRTELDQVIALARVSGARKIVSHVFLSEHIVLDGTPEPAAEAKAEPEPVRAGDEPTRASIQTNAMKAKPDATGAKKKPAPLLLDGTPEPTAEAKAEPEPVRAGGEPARVGIQTNEIKAKPDAKRAKKKPAPLPATPQTATR